VIQRLGLAEKIGPKTKLVPGDVRLIDPVVRGEVELGIYPVAEIMATQGVSLVGPFPPEIQNSTTYAVAVGTASAQSDAAKAFVTFVSGPTAAPVLAAKGIDPPAR
jgi:molybdate transport system substrate-binding protein